MGGVNLGAFLSPIQKPDWQCGSAGQINCISETDIVPISRSKSHGVRNRRKPILPSLVFMFLILPFANPMGEGDPGRVNRSTCAARKPARARGSCPMISYPNWQNPDTTILGTTFGICKRRISSDSTGFPRTQKSRNASSSVPFQDFMG